MNNIIDISAKADQKFSGSFIVLIILSLIIGTFARASLLLIYPAVAFVLAAFYHFRISSQLLLLLLLMILGTALSFFDGLFLKYKLLSLFYMIPFLLLLFSYPSPSKSSNANHLSIFIRCLTIVALINNIVGIVQIIKNPNSDDSLIGIYSQYSISINGLMLLNSFLFAYYFFQFLYSKQGFSNAIAAIFFLTFAILGFYGAGLLICIAAFILCFLRIDIKAIMKTMFISVLSIAAIYVLMLFIKPQVLEYNMTNIKKILSFDVANGPRKLTSFYNYAISYPTNAKDFLFGSGPGTFNSRSAFMIGSPSYFTSASFIKDSSQPYYFKNYAYTLWNETNTIQSAYLDGFRNQPFSSLLAFMGEYGIIFTLTFCFLYFRYYNEVSRVYRNISSDHEAIIYFRFFKFLIILLPLLLLIDNFYEHPEVMLLIIMGIKFSQQQLLTIKQNTIHELS